MVRHGKGSIARTAPLSFVAEHELVECPISRIGDMGFETPRRLSFYDRKAQLVVAPDC